MTIIPITKACKNPPRAADLIMDGWNKLSSQYSKFGAADSEPEWVFHDMIRSILQGKLHNVPKGTREWQLYDIPGSSRAADALTCYAETVFKLVSTMIERLDREDVTEALRVHLWRVQLV